MTRWPLSRLALQIMNGPDAADIHTAPTPPMGPPGGPTGSACPVLRVGWFAEGPFAPVATEVQEVAAPACMYYDRLACGAF